MADARPKILEWLHDTGYPFQLRIGRRFQAGGWSVNYSRWYRDRLTQKDRELDVHLRRLRSSRGVLGRVLGESRVAKWWTLR